MRARGVGLDSRRQLPAAAIMEPNMYGPYRAICARSRQELDLTYPRAADYQLTVRQSRTAAVGAYILLSYSFLL